MIKLLLGQHPTTFFARRAAHFDRNAQRLERLSRLDGQPHEQPLRSRRALGRLDHHRVPRHHRLHQLNADQLHRIVPGCDDEHPPNRHAVTVNAMAKAKQASAAHPPRPQQTSGVAQMPVARRNERHDVGGHRIELTLANLLLRELREIDMMTRNRVAKAAQPLESGFDRNGGFHQAGVLRIVHLLDSPQRVNFAIAVISNLLPNPPPTTIRTRRHAISFLNRQRSNSAQSPPNRRHHRRRSGRIVHRDAACGRGPRCHDF